MCKYPNKIFGFTFIEIIVSSLIVSLIFIAASNAYIMSRLFFKKSYYEFTAAEYARQTLERLMAEGDSSVLLDADLNGVLHNPARGDTPDILSLPGGDFKDIYNAVRYYEVTKIDLSDAYASTGYSSQAAKEIKVSVEYDVPRSGVRTTAVVFGLFKPD